MKTGELLACGDNTPTSVNYGSVRGLELARQHSVSRHHRHVSGPRPGFTVGNGPISAPVVGAGAERGARTRHDTSLQRDQRDVSSKVRPLLGSSTAAVRPVAPGTRLRRSSGQPLPPALSAGCRALDGCARRENDSGTRTAVSRVASPKKIMRSRHSSLTDRMKRSICGFKFGERGGNRTASTPACSSRDRNASENFASRSISRYFFPRRNPSSASVRFLATWSIHASSGFAVSPAKCTRRVASSMTKSR